MELNEAAEMIGAALGKTPDEIVDMEAKAAEVKAQAHDWVRDMNAIRMMTAGMPPLLAAGVMSGHMDELGEMHPVAEAVLITLMSMLDAAAEQVASLTAKLEAVGEE